MSRNFITGNFLRAYGQSFGRIRQGAPTRPSDLTADALAERFSTRASRYAERKERYLGGVLLGMVAALVVTIAAFNTNLQTSSDLSFELADQELVAMEEILQTTQIEKPPPPPKPPVPVEVPNDEILEDIELDLDMSLDLDEVLADLPPPPPVPVQPEPAPEQEIFVVVEQMPEMVGGIGALLSELTYPELARRAGLEGIVVIQVVIDENGQASDPKVVKSVNSVLDDEALRAVMAQEYVAGRQRGRAVKVAMNIPVTFRLRA